MPRTEAARFSEVVDAVFRVNPEPLESGVASESRILEEVRWRFAAISRDTELRGLLPSEDAPVRAVPPHLHLYLPTIWKGNAVQVPILTWKYNFSLAKPQTSLYVALLQIAETSGRLQGIGLRFETPEEPGEGSESAHNYWHAQITRGFTRERPLMDGDRALCPEWFPESYPAFPLPAYTPEELVVCMLVSLYGVKLEYGKKTKGGTKLRRRIDLPGESLGRVKSRMTSPH